MKWPLHVLWKFQVDCKDGCHDEEPDRDFFFFNGGYSPLLMLLSNSSNLVGLHTELVLRDLGLKSTLHEVIHSSPTGH